MALRPSLLRLLLASPALFSGCGGDWSTTLVVVDEHGAAVPSPVVQVGEVELVGNRDGVVHLRGLAAPVLARVQAEGHLSEPVPVGPAWAGQRLTVRLWSDADGQRFALHAGGDMMLGRRFIEPTSGEPLVVVDDGGASARAVVSDLAPAFDLADLSTVNLETVVGELSEGLAYPGKRYLLQSPPEVLDAADALGVDMVCMANNHVRDWLDVGIQSTRAWVDEAGLPATGAGMDAAEAGAWLQADVGGGRLAVLAYSTLGGESVNDYLPTDEDEQPDDSEDSLSPWKWEARTWGYPDLGILEQPRRAGSAWFLFRDLEPTLDPEAVAALWASLITVYPELQDLLARRGHGGANGWDEATSPLDVAAAAAQADVVMVQIHSGMEYAPAPSQALVDAAHQAVDAGADLVVAHHPHVLQGAEWYRGALILWSMGNLVFDQDRFITFPSAFLRTVWEADGTLLDARLLPIYMDGYRPVPVAGEAGRAVLLQAWDRSWIDGQSTRLEDGRELVVYPSSRDPQASRGAMVYEWGTGRLLPDEPAPQTEVVTLPPSGWADLPRTGLVRRGLVADPAPDLRVGRHLVGVGHFENDDVDADVDDVPGWVIDSDDAVLTGRDAATGRTSLQLVRGPDNTVPVFVRTAGQLWMPEHRFYEDEDGTWPVDGPASYSVRVDGYVHGEEDRLRVRLDLYQAGDPDPTEDAVNDLLREVELEVPLHNGRWSEVLVDVPDEAFEPVDGVRPNAAIVYLLLEPPQGRTTVARIDRVEVIEWRPAADEPDGFGQVDMVRADGPRLLELERLPW